MLFVPRAQAQKLRERIVKAPQFRGVSVSPLFRAGSGWALRLCAECRAAFTGRRHLTTRRKQTA